MRKNRGVIIIAAVLIVVVAGAVILYDILSETAGIDTLGAGHGGHVEIPGRPHVHDDDDIQPQPPGEPERESIPEAASDEDNVQNVQVPEDMPEYTPEDSPGDTPDADRTPAPDFTVQDINFNDVRLSDYRGKPIVLNFWTSWCGACAALMPILYEAFEEMGEEVHFMMGNLVDGMRETRESAEAYIRDNGYTFPVYFDVEREAAIAYAVRSIPTTFFIDAQGYAAAHAIGMINPRTLRQGIDLIK